MSEAILLTGKRGEGKTLIATMLAKRYIGQGRPVATNINFNLDKIAPPWNKTVITRLSDAPTSAELKALAPANLTYNEDKNGLILLDEVSGFLNSHDWRDSDTKEVRFWLAQSRKDGWDLLFLTQDPKQIDAQIRNSLFELHGIARNMNKVGIPVVSFLFQWFFGVKLRLPPFHVFTMRYGFGNNAAMANTEVVGGSNLFDCYDTKQKINPAASELGNPQIFGSAPATMLSAWHLRGRYMGVFKMYGKIAFSMLVIGLLVGSLSTIIYQYFQPEKQLTESLVSQIEPPKIDDSINVTGTYFIDGKTIVLLSDGKQGVSAGFKADLSGQYYNVNNTWYKQL